MENKNRQYLEYFWKHKNTLLPYSLHIASHIKGPNIICVVGMYGDETKGIEAGIKIYELLTEQGLSSGSFTLILASPDACSKNIPYINSDIDTLFTKSPSTDIEGIRAEEIMEFINHFDCEETIIVDIRTSASFAQSYVRFIEQSSISLPLLMKISPSACYLSIKEEFSIGTLINYCRKKRIKAYTVCTIDDIDEAYRHICMLLASQSVIKYDDSISIQSDITEVYVTLDRVELANGFRFTIPQPHTGLLIKAGEHYAASDNKIYTAQQNVYLFLTNKESTKIHQNEFFLCHLMKIK